MAEPAATRNLRHLTLAGRRPYASLATSGSVQRCSFPSLPAIIGSARSASAPSAPLDPSPAELAFLERVASEFAVAVESFLARQEAVRERDRLRTLFDITNALVSKLSPDELFSAISAQLSRVIRHEFSVLTLRDETGGLEMVGLHFTGAQLFDKEQGHIDPEGMPSAEALATGKPVVVPRRRSGSLPLSGIPPVRGVGLQVGLLGSASHQQWHAGDARNRQNHRRRLDG